MWIVVVRRATNGTMGTVSVWQQKNRSSSNIGTVIFVVVSYLLFCTANDCAICLTFAESELLSEFICYWLYYEGRSINKLQNGTIPLILKIGKIRNMHFVGNLILNIHRIFFDDDIIIVMSLVHRTVYLCVVFCHNSQVINSIGTREKTNELNKFMLFKC